jgi:transposase
MNRFPQDKSVIVLDNGILDRLGANVIREMILSQGVVLVSLPPHSPDYNPVEECFTHSNTHSLFFLPVRIV